MAFEERVDSKEEQACLQGSRVHRKLEDENIISRGLKLRVLDPRKKFQSPESVGTS